MSWQDRNGNQKLTIGSAYLQGGAIIKWIAETHSILSLKYKCQPTDHSGRCSKIRYLSQIFFGRIMWGVDRTGEAFATGFDTDDEWNNIYFKLFNMSN